MSKQKKLKIGVFSGYDPRPWVMEECAQGDIKTLDAFIARLGKLGGCEIVYPGERKSGYDRLCYTMGLAEEYASAFASRGVDVLINVHQTWTFPQLSQKVITSFINKMKARDGAFVPRIILASIQDTQVPGMVSGMATGGALRQIGVNYTHHYGSFESREIFDRIKETLEFYGGMADSHPAVRTIVGGLHKEHILEFGSLSLQMPTTRINQEELAARWGISSENLDQQVFLDRAFKMLEWQGEPGISRVKSVKDRRLSAALRGLYDPHPRKFSAIKERSVSRDKFALQCAMYLAVSDIAAEKGATAVTIKCQDECSSKYATCCIATSFLGNDLDLLGHAKKIIPASCETDLPTLLSQMLLSRLTGKPAGFGDFRYVKTDKSKTILAVVNCGQHPLYFAGREKDSWRSKLANTEFPGQEHFYAAGGSAMRMRTAGNQEVTLARLGVENGRFMLAATIMDTYDVDKSRHDSYNRAWPIIEGHVPVADEVLGKEWPSNHLGFAYGYHLPALVELAEQMGIGYTVWDRKGRIYHKPA